MSLRGISGLAFLLCAAPVAAQALDASSESALVATLQVLRDPALRSAALSTNASAAAAEGRVQGLVGGSPELTREFYEVAAAVMADLAGGAGGDAQAMRDALARAEAAPATLEALLSPATLARLRALAVTISDRARPRR
jgi:hypothetical protein